MFFVAAVSVDDDDDNFSLWDFSVADENDDDDDNSLLSDSVP